MLEAILNLYKMATEQKDQGSVGRNTSSSDPKLMNSRVFLGNFPAESLTRHDVEDLFKEYGKILGISLHKTYGFVQYENEVNARAAVAGWDGKVLKGQTLDVNIATERRKGPEGKQGERRKEPEGKQGDRSSDETHNDRGMRGRPSRLERGPTGRRESFEEHEERGRRSERTRWGPVRSPSPSRMERIMRMRQMELERRRLGPRMRGPPPPFDPFFDPVPPGPIRDPYFRPRDDPYERDRFREERLPPPPMRDFPPRPLPPPRDHMREPPLRRREPDPYDERWDPPHRPLPPAHEERRDVPPVGRSGIPPAFRKEVEVEKTMDMQIIVVNKQQKDYADLVKNRFHGLGLNVQLLHLSPTVSLADALDEAAESGLLYAVIVSNQNEMHRSVTLTILHGRNPQEHKNMPMEDALGLVDRDFERYCIDVREGRVPARQQRPPKNGVSSLLSKVASGEQLRPDQIDMVISTLQKQKEARGSGQGDMRHNDLQGPPPQQNSNMGRRPEAPPSANKESIQDQQADLQAKILSLLGSSAVVPSPSSRANPPQRQMGGQGEYSRPPGGQDDYSRLPADRGEYSRPPGNRGEYSRPAGDRGGYAQRPAQRPEYGSYARPAPGW